MNHRRLLQHLLDANVNLVAIKLEAPLGKSLRPRVMTAAGARGKNENAKLGHASV
jgi:hypothetical protein